MSADPFRYEDDEDPFASELDDALGQSEPPRACSRPREESRLDERDTDTILRKQLARYVLGIEE